MSPLVRWGLCALIIVAAASVAAHPMGNFSVNHYARIDLSAQGTTLTYILDFAEIPTLELFQDWKLANPENRLAERKARDTARTWIGNLTITLDGRRVQPRIREVETEISEGAGGMPVLRVGIEAELPVTSGTLKYKDENYATRAGWKEIVIKPGEGATVQQSSNGAHELSRRLRVYPVDPAIVPPQDLEGFVIWSAASIPRADAASGKRPSAVSEAVDPAPAAAPPPFSSRKAEPPGTLQSGDFLSRLLTKPDLGLGLILLGILTAFGLGAMHALSPGHGKTIVAAYLVGSRGTLKHALLLGSMVTFTHTVSVFLLGIGVLYFQQYIVPERIIPVLGAASGASIVCVGGFLLYKRLQVLAGTDDGHGHSHAPMDGSFVHTHGGSTHSHAVPDETMSLGGLIALGASGGLVPCPSALILMLSSIALGHTALGLGLLLSFSVGLAVVLMGIGTLVIYAKHLLPSESNVRKHPAFRFIPVFSAVVLMMLGILMTMTSLGMVQPLRFLG